VLQRVAECLELRALAVPSVEHFQHCSVAACGCSVLLQCVAVCCSVLQCVAVCCSVLKCVARALQCVELCCSVLQSALSSLLLQRHLSNIFSIALLQYVVAVFFSVLQCVAVC